MPDHELQSDHVRYRRRFPWLRIFDSAQIALSPASVMIATLAIVLLEIVGIFVDQVFRVSDPVQVAAVEAWPVALGPVRGIEALNETLTRPWQSVFRPLVSILTRSSEQNSRLNGLCRFVLSLGLWSLVGLILCRRSAVIFAGNDESTFGRAIQYSLRRWTASCGAPLIPLAAAVLVGLMIAMTGLFGRLPVLGGSWLFVTSPILAIMGFAIAFLLLATAVGWPIMVAAVSTDDCDSFGGLSRAYSGLTGRPWQVAFHAVLGILVGLILMRVVTLVGDFTIWCAMVCAAPGSGYEQAEQSLLGPLTTIVRQIVKGVGASYFWSVAVVIYLLLRRDTDGVPVDRVAPDDDSRPIRDPFPVVGMPATDAVTESNAVAPIEN